MLSNKNFIIVRKENNKMKENEKIKMFLNKISDDNVKNFFNLLIENCNINELLSKNTYNRYRFNTMLEDDISNITKDVDVAIYCEMIQDYILSKLIYKGNDSYCILTKKGWISCDMITKHYWLPFIQIIAPKGKLGMRNILLIQKVFLSSIRVLSLSHDIIQLKNCYIQKGKISNGFYKESLPKLNINREITEDINCDIALDLINHLCNYDSDISNWFLDEIASALILREDFKSKNGQLIRLYGSGANGKSTFTKFLQKVFNMDNITSTKLDKITTDNKYQIGNIAHSLFVIDEDASENFYKADVSSVLKTLITGEKMSVRQIYEKHKQIVPICKIIVATNHPFKSDDKTDGIHRRITEIKTGNKLIRNNEWFAKLYSDEECQAFFNLCIKRMEKIMDDFNKGIDIKIPSKIIDSKTILAKENNNVLEFIEENKDNIEFYSVKEVRNNYELWCDKNDLNPLGKTKFNETIENRLGLIRRTLKGNMLKGISYDIGLNDSRYSVKAWVKE